MTDDNETLRRVRAGDWRALRRCRLRALLFDGGSFGTSIEQASAHPDRYWQELARGHAEGADGTILLVVSSGAAVAMIRAERETPPDLFGIYSLWVAPEQRRRGLAERLMTAAEGWMVSVGGSRAELFVVESAQPARARYERLGYRPSGRLDDPRDDGVVEIGLEKRLVPPEM